MQHIPTGFQPLVPYLRMRGADGFASFCRAAFGAEVVMEHKHEGHLVHGELRIEGAMLEFGEARDAWGPLPAGLHLYVRDVDAAFARAKAAGAEVLFELADQEYGERSGGLRDRWGNEWYLATVTDMGKRTTAP
ncbi:MAG: VOC family protein [Myxococcales bacterium]|nr:VOC family protein [Myxococcales bacterium]